MELGSLLTYYKHSLCFFNRSVYLFVCRSPLENNVLIVDSDALVGLLLLLKSHEFWGFNYFHDMYAIDTLGKECRFAVIYRIGNLRTKTSIILIVYTSEGAPLPTIKDVFISARWPEREA